MGAEVLVTGATGHVGANVVAHLNRGGVRPRVLLRQTSRTTAIDDLEWSPYFGDVTDVDSLKRAMAGVSIVYHVAAMVSFARKRRADLERVNIGGTRNVIRAALATGIDRLVHTSSTAAIGVADDIRQTVDESNVWDLYRYDLVYAESKHRSERLVREAVSREGLSAVIVNPSLVLGPRDINLNGGRLFVRIQNGEALIAAPGTQSVCDVDDVARAHLAAATSGRDGQRYMVSTASMPYRTLFSKVAARVNGRPPLFTMPGPIVRLAGWLQEQLHNRDTDPPLTWEMGVQATLISNFDASRITRELGVNYTPLEETFEKTRRWLIEHGHLRA